MTRINAGMPVRSLCDEHLLAEHREIKRIPNSKLYGEPPKKFTLGKGHVTFFKDKGLYTLNRYVEIHNECKLRGFTVTDYSNNWNNQGIYYIPTPEGIELISERIIERLSKMKHIHYYGEKITSDVAIDKIKTIKQ